MRDPTLSRREFIKASAFATGAAAAASEVLPRPGYLAEKNTIQLALIGCGGRGSGAVANAIQANVGPVKLVAMADLFGTRLDVSHRTLTTQFPEQVSVPPERRFLGFDAYRKAIDCLHPGDVAVLGTHAAFRATHLEYAVGQGINVFMEKSFAADPGGIQRVLSAGEEAEERNLKIGTGLMCRHSTARQEMIQRIHNGAMGDIHLVRAYRMDAGDRMGPVPRSENELHWQIRHPYFFFWVSTGRFIDYLIHQVDECCWIKDAWPVSAQGLGGRAPDSTDCGQNLDSYAIEYAFADGARALVNGRFIPGCDADFATFLHGTKCAGQFSGNVHAPVTHIYKNQRIERRNTAWSPEPEQTSPYVAEWEALLRAIRNDQPHNETRRSALANVVAIMGRAAVHTGKTVTFDDVMNSRFQFCANASDLTDATPAPARADAAGRYPVPVPGVWREI
jgi:predicted dehydrogenase